MKRQAIDWEKIFIKYLIKILFIDHLVFAKYSYRGFTSDYTLQSLKGGIISQILDMI